MLRFSFYCLKLPALYYFIDLRSESDIIRYEKECVQYGAYIHIRNFV